MALQDYDGFDDRLTDWLTTIGTNVAYREIVNHSFNAHDAQQMEERAWLSSGKVMPIYVMAPMEEPDEYRAAREQELQRAAEGLAAAQAELAAMQEAAAHRPSLPVWLARSVWGAAHKLAWTLVVKTMPV